METVPHAGYLYGFFSTDEPTRARYIGLSTLEPSVRLSAHWSACKKRKTAIHNWLFKRIEDKDSVEFRILSCHETVEGLRLAEIEAIRSGRERGECDLNLADGGQGNMGTPRSREWYAKVSESMRGERGSSAKITQAQADEIRALRMERYVSMEDIGSSYGLTRRAIGRILDNTSYADPNYDPTLIVKAPPEVFPLGVPVGTSRVSEEQVREIRALAATGRFNISQKAREVGVAGITVQRILRNTSHRDPLYAPPDWVLSRALE